MKYFIAALLVSTQVHARQMFQCSSPDVNNSTVMVVNLQTPTAGTLFLSAGMDTNERVLFNVEFEKSDRKLQTFKVLVGEQTGLLFIPTQVVGKVSDNVNLVIDLPNFGREEFSCFTRLYE